MDKHFNTAGPGIPELHYRIDPLSRIDLEEILSLFDQRSEALPWEQRMQASETTTASGRPVLVLRG